MTKFLITTMVPCIRGILQSPIHRGECIHR
jgi:hypothetical protein